MGGGDSDLHYFIKLDHHVQRHSVSFPLNILVIMGSRFLSLKYLSNNGKQVYF